MQERLSTGVEGLDEVLRGGLPPAFACMVRGGPGTGKTTLGLHFLNEGVTHGEPVLFVGLEHPEDAIKRAFQGMPFDLGAIPVLDLGPKEEAFAGEQVYSIFSPGDVERSSTTARIVERIESARPRRIFIDGFTQLRNLSPTDYQFRRQVVSFLRFLTDRDITVLFSSESTSPEPDFALQYMSDCIISLEQAPNRRTCTVEKFIGSGFVEGRHSMKLTDEGMVVFPRMEPLAHGREFTKETIPSGVREIDTMLCGGIERGTVTLVSGPSGVGKTTFGLQFIKEAATRGERSVVYTFEEERTALLDRAEGIGMPLREIERVGNLGIVPVDPLLFAPGELPRQIQREVEECGARVIMIDGLEGFRLSLRDEDIEERLRALTKFLQRMGTTALLTARVERLTGDFRITELGVSYLADNIVVLRFIEFAGELHKAIGVVKKRETDFEKTLREYAITGHGIKVGEPLTDLRGVLTGTPDITGGRRVEPGHARG